MMVLFVIGYLVKVGEEVCRVFSCWHNISTPSVHRHYTQQSCQEIGKVTLAIYLCALKEALENGKTISLG